MRIRIARIEEKMILRDQQGDTDDDQSFFFYRQFPFIFLGLFFKRKLARYIQIVYFLLDDFQPSKRVDRIH